MGVSSMKSVTAFVEPVEIELSLQDELSPAILKKLQTLGWPEIWLRYSLDRTTVLSSRSGSLVSYVEGPFGETIPLSAPANGTAYSMVFDADRKKFRLKFAGEFAVYSMTDDESASAFEKIKHAYFSAVVLTDKSGKPIKLPKDEFGMARALEAYVDAEDRDVYVKVSLSVEVRDV